MMKCSVPIYRVTLNIMAAYTMCNRAYTRLASQFAVIQPTLEVQLFLIGKYSMYPAPHILASICPIEQAYRQAHFTKPS